MSATSRYADATAINPDDELEAFDASGFDTEIDLSAIDENAGPPPIPAGTYVAKVKDCVFGKSKGNQNPQWVWTFEVTMPDTNRTRFVNHYTPFLPDQLAGFKRVVKAVAGPEVANGKISIVDDAPTMKGNYCQVKIAVTAPRPATDQYKAQPAGNKITAFMPMDDQGTASFL